jgi:hypothetical protein
MGIKHEWSDTRDCIILEFTTRVNLKLFMGKLWNILRRKAVWLYKSPKVLKQNIPVKL